MKSFAQLYQRLDQTNKTNEKVAHLVRYFDQAPPADAAWAIYFLSGRKIRRLISTNLLRSWACQLAQIDDWLFTECYEAVGDLAETLALIVPKAKEAMQDTSLANWVQLHLQPLREKTDPEKRVAIIKAWNQQNQYERLVFNKLLTGAFRVGVSQKLVVRAVADVTHIDRNVIAHRLMGDWQPTPEFYARVLDPDTRDSEGSQPYPFFLAQPLEAAVGVSSEQCLIAEHVPQSLTASATQQEPDAGQETDAGQTARKPPASREIGACLGDPAQWLAEWKWDGIRAQIIQRGQEVFIWSRGEELMTQRFPELVELAEHLPDGTVLDGEIVADRQGTPLPFTELQRRIGLKRVSKRIRQEVPVAFIAFDQLEAGGVDLRVEPLRARQARLIQTMQSTLVAACHAAAKAAQSYRRRNNAQQMLLFDEPTLEAATSIVTQDMPNTQRDKMLTTASGSINRSHDQQQTNHQLVQQHCENDLPAAQLLQLPNDTPDERDVQWRFRISPTLHFASWDELAELRTLCRKLTAEGVMLKRIDSPYRSGRPRGDWWKWKIEPYTIDAVMINAQRGHGRRASMYTDYTFAVWSEGELVPFTKAYSGLTDEELRKVDYFVRRNTTDRFGPVRSVKPELVFELAFENIQVSSRHKSGIAVRFPRILRWRHDKKIEEADSLDTILAMLPRRLQEEGDTADG